MKFLICDETNTTWDSKLNFLIYGGLVLDPKDLYALAKDLIEIKKIRKVDNHHPIKWPNKRWNGGELLDAELHKKIKKDILNLLETSNAKLLLYFAPQDYYHVNKLIPSTFSFRKKVDKEKQLKAYMYAINVCAYKFQKKLEQEADYGMVIADSFEDRHKNQLKEHCHALFCNGGDFSSLNRIVAPVIELKEEWSHIHQVNDVVLGAIQDSLKEMHPSLLHKIKNLFYSDGSSFNIYPKHEAPSEIVISQNVLREKLSRLLKEQI
jgi:hypothetical protein